MGSEAICYEDGDPPLAVIVTAEFAGLSLDLTPNSDPELILLPEYGTVVIVLCIRDILFGNYDILQRFASAATFPNFYKSDDEYTQKKIQKFISSSFPKSFAKIEKFCANIDKDLRRKSCLVGPFFSVADIFVWLAFAGKASLLFFSF